MSFSYGDDRDGRTAPLLAGAVVGLVVGALAVAVIWAVQARTGSDDDIRKEPSAEAAPGAGLFEPRSASATSSRLDRCREVFDAQTEALTAAASSLDQWEVHIGAMNKLVTGAITLEQAQEFWDSTRVGAVDRLKRFDAGDRKFDRRTARCPAPRGSSVDPDLRSCAEAVAARNQALGLGSVAIETWRMHVHHMEMLRDGEMTAQQATKLWLQSWHQGNREVMAYRGAAKDAQGLTC